MTQAIISAVLLVAGIGLVASLLISVASTFMSVKVNEKEVAVRDCLPGANCGACGYSGCDAYAKAVAEDSSVPANLCRPGGASVAKAVADVMGVEAPESKPMAAFVHCHGDCFNNAQKEIYYGLESCAAAKMLYGGKGACTAGCLGSSCRCCCGSCLRSCLGSSCCYRSAACCTFFNNNIFRFL